MNDADSQLETLKAEHLESLSAVKRNQPRWQGRSKSLGIGKLRFRA
jgi:hypothetical protein